MPTKTPPPRACRASRLSRPHSPFSLLQRTNVLRYARRNRALLVATRAPADHSQEPASATRGQDTVRCIETPWNLLFRAGYQFGPVFQQTCTSHHRFIGSSPVHHVHVRDGDIRSCPGHFRKPRQEITRPKFKTLPSRRSRHLLNGRVRTSARAVNLTWIVWRGRALAMWHCHFGFCCCHCC